MTDLDTLAKTLARKCAEAYITGEAEPYVRARRILEATIEPLLRTALAAERAKCVAVLEECRYSVKVELELLAHLDGPERIDELTDRLSRIDALLGGK